MTYEQWLPCDVVVDAEPSTTALTVASIVEHMTEHLRREGADVSLLMWTCEVRDEPYPVYAFMAA